MPTRLTRRDFIKSMLAGVAAALGLGAVPVAEAEPKRIHGRDVTLEVNGTTLLSEMPDDGAWFRINGGDWMRLSPLALDRLSRRNFIEGDPASVPVGIIGEV